MQSVSIILCQFCCILPRGIYSKGENVSVNSQLIRKSLLKGVSKFDGSSRAFEAMIIRKAFCETLDCLRLHILSGDTLV